METNRLIMRKLAQEDLDRFCLMSADGEVMKYFPGTLSRAESIELFNKLNKRFDSRGWGIWALELKSTGEFIGFTGLNEPHDDLPFTPCVEIVWRLLKEYWHLGYATEAANKALEFAFDELDLNEIIAFTTLSNKKSQSVMHKIGMKNSGKNFNHPSLPKNSKLRYHVLYKLNKKEFLN